MAHKATAPEAAERVLEARELACAGASTAVIERLSRFGPRFVRGLVREYGGALACKPRDPLRWLRDHRHLAHVPYVVLFYECQLPNLSPASLLLDTFFSYRTHTRPGILDINECHQIIELYQRGDLRERQCSKCPLTYFVLLEEPVCPKCRLKEQEFCRGCGAQKRQVDSHPRAYCDACSPTISRKARGKVAEVEPRIQLPGLEPGPPYTPMAPAA
jgi:hypothetical protein